MKLIDFDVNFTDYENDFVLISFRSFVNKFYYTVHAFKVLIRFECEVTQPHELAAFFFILLLVAPYPHPEHVRQKSAGGGSSIVVSHALTYARVSDHDLRTNDLTTLRILFRIPFMTVEE